MRNAGLDEAQAGIKIPGRNINNLRYTDDTESVYLRLYYQICNINNLRYTESEEELKSLLMKVKEESEKADLKLNIQKMKIMASGAITSWQIHGKQWKQWETLFGGTPKSLQMVTAAMKLKNACSLKEKL